MTNILIVWLVSILTLNGYSHLLGKLGNEEIENIKYAHDRAIALNIDAEKFILLQACESSFKSSARGDYRSETNEYLAWGPYQWWLSSWNGYSKEYNYKGLRSNPKDNIDMAAFIISKGGINNWFNCNKKIKMLK